MKSMSTQPETVREALTLMLLYTADRSLPSPERPYAFSVASQADPLICRCLRDRGCIAWREGADHIDLLWPGEERARTLLAAHALPDPTLCGRFLFRPIEKDEIDAAAAIEQICFPPNEACSPGRMRERIEAAPDLFLAAIHRESGALAGFLNGIATDETVFRDAFFTDASLHRPKGANVMLLGLDVLPAYRRQGLARELVHAYARREEARGRKMLYLTCLEEKVEMYRKFGFADRGLSASVWGGEAWHDMTCALIPPR